MNWDFYAYGGGDIYRDVFNAVALMSGANAMDSLLRLALVLGLCMGIVKAVTDFNVGAILKWYIFAVVIYGILWVPKVTVHVTDRLNPSAVYADVGNVPLGVGATAAMVSQIGDRIIALTQTSFADPTDLSYSAHGMVFGAKMFAKINQLRPTNQLVAQNLTSYMQNCAFYDIQDGTVPINTLSNSQDMWQTLTASPNPARLVPYTNTDGTSVLKKCTDDAVDVGNDMNADNSNVQKMLFSSLSSTTADSALANQENNVSAAVATAIGSSQDALTIIRQSVTRNMMQDSLNGYGGDPNGVLGATMAELQTQNTQNLFGEVAEKAVVDLKIVIELLFIGIFPAIFPLFLLPKLGPEMAKGYLSGFFYLQLWGPMYVILHKIMMWNAVNHGMQATYLNGGGHAVTALTLDALAKANQDVCSLAGSMMLMIPVLAGLVTKGAMSVGAQGEALLGNFRSGAESASSSMTTGNWSFGNTAVANHSYDDVNAHQHITSPYFDEARSTTVAGNGVTRTRWADGSETDQAALSTGAIGANMSKTYGETLNRSASTMLEASQNIQSSYQVGKTQTDTAMREVFSGSQSGTNTLSSFSHDNQQSISDLKSHVDQTLEEHGITTEKGKQEFYSELLAGTAGVNADGSLGLQEAGTGAKVGVSGSASKTGSHGGQDSHSSNERSNWAASLQDSFNHTASQVASDRALQQFDKTTSNFAGKRNVTSASFSSQKARNDTATWLQGISHRTQQEASNYMQGVNNLTSDQTTALFNFIGDKVGRDSDLFGQILHQSTPEGRDAFQKLGAEFMKGLADNEIAGFERAIASPLSAPPASNQVRAAEGVLGVTLPDQASLDRKVDQALPIDPAAPAHAPAHRSGTGGAQGHGHGGHDGGAHHNGARTNGAPAPANDQPSAEPRLPTAISMHTSTSDQARAELAAQPAAHALTVANIESGKQNTGGDINTKPKITNETKDTVRKVEHGAPIATAVVENMPYGIGEAARAAEDWANSGHDKRQPDGQQTDPGLHKK